MPILFSAAYSHVHAETAAACAKGMGAGAPCADADADSQGAGNGRRCPHCGRGCNLCAGAYGARGAVLLVPAWLNWLSLQDPSSLPSQGPGSASCSEGAYITAPGAAVVACMHIASAARSQRATPWLQALSVGMQHHFVCAASRRGVVMKVKTPPRCLPACIASYTFLSRRPSTKETRLPCRCRYLAAG